MISATRVTKEWNIVALEGVKMAMPQGKRETGSVLDGAICLRTSISKLAEARIESQRLSVPTVVPWNHWERSGALESACGSSSWEHVCGGSIHVRPCRRLIPGHHYFQLISPLVGMLEISSTVTVVGLTRGWVLALNLINMVPYLKNPTRVFT